MTTINTSLAGYLATTDEKKKTGVADADTLTDILTPEKDKAKEAPEDAVTLNLSDEAKAMLEEASPLFTDFSGERFILTARQRQTIESIIQKYKNAPFTDETYAAIMADLDDAGLSPELLTIKEQVMSVNPFSIFLAAMNGQEMNFDQLGNVSEAVIETKQNNYLLDIVARWHSLSTYEAETEEANAGTEVAEIEGN